MAPFARNSKKTLFFPIAGMVLLIILAVLFYYRISLKQTLEMESRKIFLPAEVSSSTVRKAVAENKEIAKINIFVPFVSQAPLGIWDAVHEETCEESSVLMIEAFIQVVKDYPRQEMEDNLQKMIAWEKDTFGYFEDTTVEETARIMTEYLGIKNVKVYYNISINDIKKELLQGRPVIVPTAGKILPNPYFKNGGPVYHMLVVKGFTNNNKFITNDPGTNTLGENLTYNFNDLYNAIHDWVKDGDILTGKKAMIVVE